MYVCGWIVYNNMVRCMSVDGLFTLCT